MDDNSNGLMTTYTSLPDTLPEDDYTRRLFRCFREVFVAENQPQRAVFWVEEVRGNIILRHVRNLNRTRKIEDNIVGRLGNDFDAVKIAIGNYAAGSATTTVRWEIYADFALTQLVECGRFDFHDLLPRTDFSEISKLKGQLVGDWDFDSILLTHKCLHCNGIFNRKSVLYVSHYTCEQCGKAPTWDHARDTIVRLMRKHTIRANALTVHTNERYDNEFKVQYFVDPLPNSVVYWWITNQLANSIEDQNSTFSGDQLETLNTLYRASLFRLMRIPSIRSAFESYLKTIDGEDWELFMGQLAKFGELLETTFRQKSRDHIIGCSQEYVRFALPRLINQVIMGHVLGSQTNIITVM